MEWPNWHVVYPVFQTVSNIQGPAKNSKQLFVKEVYLVAHRLFLGKHTIHHPEVLKLKKTDPLLIVPRILKI